MLIDRLGCTSAFDGAYPSCPISPTDFGDPMTMPTDADAAVENHGSNDGPREHETEPGTVEGARVDDENVPHPPHDEAVEHN